MKQFKIILTCAVMVLGFQVAVNAQQIPLLDHYYVNPFLSNPAMAGNNGNHVYLIHRSQWLDVQGAPETTVLTADGLVADQKVGLGLMAFRDQTNIVGKTGFFGTYSYKLPLNDESQLSFGLSIGLEQNRLLFDRVQADDPVEVTLIQSVKEYDNFDANFGVNYNLEGLNLGLAAFQLFANQNEVADQQNFTSYQYSYFRHYLVTASYLIPFGSDNWSLLPVAQVRFAKDVPAQFDASAIVNYRSKMWVGAGYRDQFGMNFTGGLRIADKFVASYSYGTSLGDIQKLSQNTHEIMLGLALGGGNGGKNGDTDKDGIMNGRDIEPETPHWAHVDADEPYLDASKCIVDDHGVAKDTDKDGVPDCVDLELESPYGAPVDKDGVAKDADQDGVPDGFDREENTPEGCDVDRWGVSLDGDRDGVPNCKDDELKSPPGAPVDENGVALDGDKDGIPDLYDLQPQTMAGCKVNERGVALDDDKDGVPNCRDKELNTPAGVGVDADGVGNDDDRDGVPDQLDLEPNSTSGCKVDKWGRCLEKKVLDLDADGDGVPNEKDLEPETPSGATVDEFGRATKGEGDPLENRIDLDEMVDNDAEWEYHVVIGVFKYYDNVRNYQKHLFRVYGENTKLLVTKQNFYYVWTKIVVTKEEAAKEINRLQEKDVEDYIVGNPWIWREAKKK